jgi:hypothetical protein
MPMAAVAAGGTSSAPGATAPTRNVELPPPSAPSHPSRPGGDQDEIPMNAPPAPATPPPRYTPPPRSVSAGRRYGFNCGYCSSRLEANEGMAGTEGQCPTCGNSIVIPILDRFGRLIDPITKQIIKQDPHPVHAYAAAGDRAPKILRRGDGSQVIQCPRCQSVSPISSNNCKSCGMPFTMEGTTLDASGASNGPAVASLVLGIIGIPAFCTFVLPLLAVIFGVVALVQLQGETTQGGRGMAIAGIVCGLIGCVLAVSRVL